MTFYWWSHWFWITVLGSILLSITIVQTYPSQEISLEYNQNSKTVTKLYQTATTLTWVTPAPPPNNNRLVADAGERSGSGSEKTILQSVVTPQTVPEAGEQQIVEQSGDEDRLVPADQYEEVATGGSGDGDGDVDGDFEDLEYKRSAENANNTHVEGTAEKQPSPATGNNGEMPPTEVDATVGESPIAADAGEVNNYTNFSSAAGKNATSGNGTDSVNAKSLASPAPPPPSKGNAAAPARPEWVHAMAQIPAAVTVSDDSDAAASSASTTVHKVPFTLENANKEEELLRAETEHRSRKSKVLSAEYKHINRFINLSADSKSLLTRSASTAPNEYDNDEGNISSEALAIQRTYFLDAGAISAICFTVFGICCTVGTIGIVLYRRRYVNKPQALSEPDSSVYIDDSTMRDNSDEMYSLDNDSFLNSLEAMTIQNYWTDTVKHTKL